MSETKTSKDEVKLVSNMTPTELYAIMGTHDSQDIVPHIKKKISKRLEYTTWKKMKENTISYCYINNDVLSKRDKFYSSLGDDILNVLKNNIVYSPRLK